MDHSSQGAEGLRERVDALSDALSELIGAVESTLPPDARERAVSERLDGAREALTEPGSADGDARRAGRGVEGSEPIAEALMRGDRVWTALVSSESAAETLLTLSAVGEDDLRAALLSRVWLERSSRLPDHRFAEWSESLREFVGWSSEEDGPQSPSS